MRLFTAIAAIRIATVFQPTAARLMPGATPSPAATAITRAIAPPGGWMQRSQPMIQIEMATASAGASQPAGSQLPQARPIKAGSSSPPMTYQGWARGLWGSVNTITEVAPSGASSRWAWGDTGTTKSTPSKISTPSSAAVALRQRSAGERGAASARR